MALTAKEKMRRYRERLKNQNPEKYDEQRKKNLARIKSKKKRISEMEPGEAEAKRKEWREEKRRNRQPQHDTIGQATQFKPDVSSLLATENSYSEAAQPSQFYQTNLLSSFTLEEDEDDEDMEPESDILISEAKRASVSKDNMTRTVPIVIKQENVNTVTSKDALSIAFKNAMSTVFSDTISTAFSDAMSSALSDAVSTALSDSSTIPFSDVLTNQKWCEVADQKLKILELTELKIMNEIDENDLRIRLMNKEHEAKMEVIKLELDIKKKMYENMQL